MTDSTLSDVLLDISIEHYGPEIVSNGNTPAQSLKAIEDCVTLAEKQAGRIASDHRPWIVTPVAEQSAVEALQAWGRMNGAMRAIERERKAVAALTRGDDGRALAPRRKAGISLSKLADATPAIVRSVAEQQWHERIADIAVPVLELRRKKLRSEKRHNVTLALRKLQCPMFGIEYEGTRMFVSANVLSDYVREGLKPIVFSMPDFNTRVRYYRADRRTRASAEQWHSVNSRMARANDHAMGLAQNAYRWARLEGDKEGMRVAYHWLYHGNMLKPCNAPECPCCKSERKRVLQANLLAVLALAHAAPMDWME